MHPAPNPFPPGFVLALLLFFAVLFGVLMHAHAQQARVSAQFLAAFAEAVKRLGYSHYEVQRAWGMAHGTVLMLGCHEAHTRNSRYWVTTVRVNFHPAFDLRMKVGGARVRSFWETKPAPVFGDAFDERFELTAEELPRLKALLRYARAALGRANSGGCEVTLDDERLALDVPGPLTVEGVIATVHLATEIVAALERARPEVPPSARLEPLAKGLAQTAERFGMRLMTTPLALAGSMAGLDVYCHAVALPEGRFGAQVVACFPSPLGLGLSIRNQHQEAAYRGFGEQEPDVEIGDAAFDRAFLIRTRSADRLRGLLEGGLRDELLAMRDGGAVELTDEALTYRLAYLPVSDALPALVDRVAAQAARIHARATADTRGVYR